MKKRRFTFSQATLERLRAHDRELPGTPGQAEPAAAPEEHPAGESAIVRASMTDVGLVRANNQDTVLETDRVIGVCDGMGGHRGGEVASALAAEVFLSALQGREPSAAALLEAVSEANSAVYTRAQTDESLSGMGTTLTALWLGQDKAFIAHVGDSRCYLYRGGALRQMTEDHSMVMEMVRAGLLEKDQAEHHPMRNIITRAVGTDTEVETDVAEEPREAGDIWLVCSDGLHGMVPDEHITGVLTALGRQPEQAVRVLRDAAIAAGGRDNISVAILWDREGRA